MFASVLFAIVFVFVFVFVWQQKSNGKIVTKKLWIGHCNVVTFSHDNFVLSNELKKSLNKIDVRFACVPFLEIPSFFSVMLFFFLMIFLQQI